MIDYFALALGHGLLAIALLRLVLREELDVDPLIEQITADTANNRKAVSSAARNAARRARRVGDADADADDPGDTGSDLTIKQHSDSA